MKFGSSTGIIALSLTLLVLNFILFDLQEKELIEQEHWLAQVQLNFATDAALFEGVRALDTSKDYTVKSKVEINPEVARYEFNKLIELGYPLTLSKDVSLLTIVGFDGMYFYSSIPEEAAMKVFYKGNKEPFTGTVLPVDKVRERVDRALPTPKIPYFYKDGERLYTLNMGNRDYTYLDDSGEIGIVENTSAVISDSDKWVAINENVSRAFFLEMEDLRKNGTITSSLFPAELSRVSSNNAIKGVSVLAYVDNGTGRPVFSLAGSQTKESQKLIGYGRDKDPLNPTAGYVLYYCYENENHGVPLLNIIRKFNSPEEAAQNGYYRDLFILK